MVPDESLRVVGLAIDSQLVQLVLERVLVLPLESAGACARRRRICSQLLDERLELSKLCRDGLVLCLMQVGRDLVTLQHFLGD